GPVAVHQPRQKQQQPAQLGREASGGQAELAPVGYSGRLRLGPVRQFVVGTAGQAGETFLAQDLPDGRVTQRGALGLERPFDVIDGKILFAQGNNEGASGVGFGLSLGTGLALAEEIKGLAAELAAQNSKGAWAVAEAAGDLARGEVFDEKSAQGLVLALGRRWGFEEEAGRSC